MELNINTKITFGKYKSKKLTYAKLLRKDRSYALWLYDKWKGPINESLINSINRSPSSKIWDDEYTPKDVPAPMKTLSYIRLRNPHLLLDYIDDGTFKVGEKYRNRLLHEVYSKSDILK